MRTRHSPCSQRAPARNRRPPKASRFTGLSKKFNRWKALIKVHGKRKELGSFAAEEDAARCYDKHAVLAWGVRCAAASASFPSRCSLHAAPCAWGALSGQAQG